MTLTFRDSQILILAPGSDQTLIQCGLVESLPQPELYVPTRVYKTGGKLSHHGSDADAIAPLVRGEIADQAAFCFFIKGLYKTATERIGIAPALLLLKDPSWSKRQLEHLAKYLFEECGVPALTLLNQSLSKAFALTARDCIVVDVGLDKTTVSLVHDFESPTQYTHVIAEGGSSIDAFLAKEFGLDAQQAEDAKLSGIVEIPTGQPEELNVEAEEGVVDVAAIVSSGKMREILQKREAEKRGELEDTKQNADLAENTFTDRHGAEHTLGTQRFEACDALLAHISKVVGLLVGRIPARARAAAWANLIVTGRGALVPGFRQGLLSQLEKVYLVSNTSIGAAAAQPFGTPDVGTRQTPNEGDAPAQAPTAIKLAQIAEHFPEWKHTGWTQCGFLGAQIAAKQSFTTQAAFFVSRQDYNEIGPQAIWDL